jgi:hypothetical protein
MFLAGDPETLRLLVVDLCDEVEQLEGELDELHRKSFNRWYDSMPDGTEESVALALRVYFANHGSRDVGARMLEAVLKIFGGRGESNDPSLAFATDAWAEYCYSMFRTNNFCPFEALLRIE